MRSRRRERARWVGQTYQRLQHAVPAAVLLSEGLREISAGVTGWPLVFAGGELVFSALLLVSVARNLRRTSGHEHAPAAHAIEWTDLFAAVVIGMETFAHWRDTGHLSRPNVLMVVMLLALGLFHGQILGWARARRGLSVTSGVLRLGGYTPWHPGFSIRLADIARIEIGDREAAIVARSGRTRRINLADLENAPDVVAALHTVHARLS